MHFLGRIGSKIGIISRLGIILALIYGIKADDPALELMIK
jgi:hypothetical protein